MSRLYLREVSRSAKPWLDGDQFEWWLVTRQLVLLLLAALLGLLSSLAFAQGKLHVPSPDWRDQIIYFVLTDRFADGDSTNNDQHAGEFDPGDGRKYSGGDLRGIEQRIDYIRNLGATAVWITPPVLNQWWDNTLKVAGYHGYWASDFMALDPHLGTLSDYQQLSRALHGAGMYLIQDVVVNHTGNYFSYDGGWDRQHPERFFQLHPDSLGHTAPVQWPFSLNDPRVAAQRKAAIYHWTPDIDDYNDAHQRLDFQMSGLDDLNTENPVVRRALRNSFAHWVRDVGVDGFRVDTAFYVTPEFFTDFLYARDPQAPGIDRIAKQTGREHFLAFGEGFAMDKPYESTQARKINDYIHGPQGQPRLSSMLNFPLYSSSGDVFARGHPPAELAHRIQSVMSVHRQPQLMPSFVDNHDVDRYLATANVSALEQNLLLLMSLPGIPVIYYGTEQGFTEQRSAMFKSGWHSGGVDHFDASAPLYRFIQRVTALRHQQPVLSRGRPTVLRADANGPGVLAYRMTYGSQAALVMFNTSDQPQVVQQLPTGAAPAAVWLSRFSIEGPSSDLIVSSRGWVQTTLPAHSGFVWTLTPTTPAQAGHSTAVPRLRFTAPPPFITAWPWKLLGEVQDPPADDHGPSGKYRYPTDPSWGGHHQMDILGLRVWQSGDKLRIDVRLNQLTNSWNPTNGFDHVALTVFIEVPGKADGVSVMPQQNAVLPNNMRWHYRIRTHGWSNALFSSVGATAESEGAALPRSPLILADQKTQTVSLMLDRASLGDLASFSGLRFYVNTWDFDGGYRALQAQPQRSIFGGGDGNLDPLVMDDTAVLSLP